MVEELYPKINSEIKKLSDKDIITKRYLNQIK